MKYSLVAAFFLICFVSSAQEKDKWDVNEFKSKYSTLHLNVSEGTWMNLDVSPDGSEIVFDHLGNIYSLPISGGSAKQLIGDNAFDVQPRYSADGSKILFTSDRSGGDNIWYVENSHKSNNKPEQITNENFRLLNNAVWMPNGDYIIARKHFTSTRSIGAGELWMYHISGGSGTQLTKRKNDQQDVGEPCISSDGRYLYYSEDMYPGGYFQYNKDPNKQIYVIKRYDLKTGETKTILGGPGGACRPQISRDGKKMAYIRRVRAQSVLYIMDLENGTERPLFWQKLSKDQQESWAIFGVYTGYNWGPKDEFIVIWGKGKLWKVNTTDGSFAEIPFNVETDIKIADAIRFKQKAHVNEFTSLVTRHAVTSPDESLLAFNAAGYIWLKDLPNGVPRRFTNGKDFEFAPSFSPDGKELVYVSWNDEEKGSIRKARISKKLAKPVQLTEKKGIYKSPVFSPDGKTIVFVKSGGERFLGFSYSVNPGIYTIASAGGDMKLLVPEGREPRYIENGNRVFYQTGGGLSKNFHSVDLNGEKKRTLFTTKYARDVIPSPDGKWVAFTELYKAYVAPFPETGKTFELSKDTKAVPISQIARDAGVNLHWNSNSQQINWTYAGQYFQNSLSDRFTFLEGSPDSIPPMDSLGIDIGLKLQSDVPVGRILLSNARIITMNSSSQVIENGSILIDGNQIMAIGIDFPIPDDCVQIDCTGKTIIPGIIDAHAHMGQPSYISPQKQSSYYANLAYGVTTTHDPSANSEMIFSQSEMQKMGLMLAPRIFSTGTILYGADGDFKAPIGSLEDARSAIRRTMAYGTFSVKSYNQPQREQRQQVIQAARELKCHVYPEGGSTFYHNLTMILDGHTGIEHCLPIGTLYSDVLSLFAASKTAYTPTLIVAYSGIMGENYWYHKTKVWEKEHLLNFTPRYIVDSRSRRPTMAPDEEYFNGHLEASRSCTDLTKLGTKVNLGAHGQLNGLGAHWELWMIKEGGMNEMDALRCATYNGAYYLGMEDELGSLEKGKLADLVVLDKNPLESIYNTEFTKYTMVNGRLYDTQTMNQVAPDIKERTKFWWEFEGHSQNFPHHRDQIGKCSCQGSH